MVANQTLNETAQALYCIAVTQLLRSRKVTMVAMRENDTTIIVKRSHGN